MLGQYQHNLYRPTLAIDQLIERDRTGLDVLDEHLFITDAFMQLYYHLKALLFPLNRHFQI